MAFVYQSERFKEKKKDNPPKQILTEEKVEEIPKKLTIKNQLNIPFNKLEKRFKEDKNTLNIGPGQYNINVSTFQKNIKMPFKSKVKRNMNNEKDFYPGPGQYFLDTEIDLQKKQYQQLFQKLYTNKLNIAQEILKLNQYQPVSSIPTSNQYVTEPGEALESLSILEQHKKAKDMSNLGPGAYHISHYYSGKHLKGLPFSKTTSKRDRKLTDVSQNAGPGDYDPGLPKNHYSQDLELSTFASKAHKFPVKGQISNLQRKKFLSKLAHKSGFKNNEIMDQLDDLFEYEEDVTPGPGYYNYDNLSAIKPSYKQHRFQCFGSSSVRFPEQLKKIEKQIQQPQLTEHQPHKNNQLKYKQSKKEQIPFGSQSLRFNPNILNSNPGPGQYLDAYNNSNQVAELSSAPFGSNQKKFSYISKIFEKQPEIGYYEKEYNFPSKQYDNQSYYFKQPMRQKSRLQIKRNDSNPPIGTYNDEHLTIKKYLEKIDENKDIYLKQQQQGVAFNSGVKRKLYQPSSKNEQYDDILYDLETLDDSKQSHSIIALQKMKKVDTSFGVKEKRFKDENPNQNYSLFLNNPSDDFHLTWNKKSYNIKFQKKSNNKENPKEENQ